MKKISITLLFIACYFMQVKAQEEIVIDTDKSVVNWIGSKQLGFGNHYGTVQFKSGKFIKTGEVITGGEFIIDMRTIANIDGGYNDGLVDHLKNEDFFNIHLYPEASLEMTSITYNDDTHLKIKADLTIKGITLPVEFDAELDYEQKKMYTNFTIDRTRWDITYSSEGITNIIKEHAISDEIGFKVEIGL